MKTPLIYLAHPIDWVNSADEHDLVAEAKRRLVSLGFAVYDPAAAWDVPKDGVPHSNLHQANLGVIARCDALLALLRGDILSIGTVLEVDYAYDLAKPVAVVGPGVEQSWSLASYFGHLHKSSELDPALEWLWSAMTEQDQNPMGEAAPRVGTD